MSDTEAIAAVRSLFHELLKNQARWVVFFWYQCDDISVLNYQSVEELCEAITAAYRRASDQPCGFCSLFNNAAFSAVLPTETKLQEGLL